MLRFILSLLLIFFLTLYQAPTTYAQQNGNLYATPIPTATASAKSKSKAKPQQPSVTEPEAQSEKKAILTLLEKRGAGELSYKNFIPHAVLYAVNSGVPANTIILILLLPLLATIIVSFRYLIGLSGLGLLVPIALSVTLLATGLTPGFILLAAILIASFFSRFVLKRIRIMQMPKMALSMLVAAIFVVATLTASAAYGIFDVINLSIFPILVFLLLSDRIVALFLERNLSETIQTTLVTLLLGILGFALLSWDSLRSLILLYPELILLLIPLNILIGRYFGLRVTEYIKFQPVIKNANK